MTQCLHATFTYLRLSPFARFTRFECIFSSVFDSFQKVHLFEISAATSVGIEFVLDVTRLSDVCTPVHRRLV